MPLTTRIIRPDSGSSRNAQSTRNAPIPSTVSSGIAGIHEPSTTSCTRASEPSNWMNA